MGLHSPTLLLTVLMLVTLMTTIIFFSWRFNPRMGGLREWFFAFFAALLNITLFVSQPEISSSVTIFVLQVLQLSTSTLGLIAMYRYLERDDIPFKLILGSAGALLLVDLIILSVMKHPQFIFAMSSVMTGVHYLALTRIMWPGQIRLFPARGLFSMIACLHGLFMIGRIVLFVPAPSGQMFNQGGLSGPQLILLEQTIITPLFGLGLLMLANEKSASELRQLAEIDSLTNLYNRRAFFKGLEQAHSFVRRTQSRLCIFVLDVDYFKNINDSHGHDVGDAVLKQVTTTILGCLRKEDVMGRLGGEEFAIYMLNTDLSDALLIAERIRAKVNDAPMAIRGHSIACSVSIGVSAFDGSEPIDRLLRRADQAMYSAKANGRNRVELALG